MKNPLLNTVLVLAFLVVLAVVTVSGWFLFHQFDSLGVHFGGRNWEEMDQEALGTETFEGSIESFSIKSVAGSIRIEAWEGESLEVEYLKKGASEEALERINVRMEQNGNEVKVWTEFPAKRIGNNGRVEYRVKIPGGLEKLDAESVSGSIQVGEEADSPLFDEMEMELQSVSGSVFTTGAGDLTIESVSGSLTFNARGHVDAETVSGRIAGTMEGNSENHSIDAESVSGALRFDIPEDWGGSIRMNSLSGSLKCSLPVILEKQDRNSLEGRLGEGNGRLRLKTTSGSIRIE